MRRTWIVVVLVVATVASAAGYQRVGPWKEFRYASARLMADLNKPDALIRTQSLAKLPHDLLKAPIAKEVLTEDLAFYYEQHEDRRGLNGSIKRIAYEHKVDWTDRILATALDEPAEVALWRDGKGALRHFAIVMQQRTLAKVLREAAVVALKDQQLTLAGEIEIGAAAVKVYALAINPRRTLLLIASGDRMVVLSDPGLLFDKGNKVTPDARAAIAEWLTDDGALIRRFALAQSKPADVAQPIHTLVIGAPTLTLGYAALLSGFKGLRFDFGARWSTYAWIDPQGLPQGRLGDAAVWRAAPANPSACMLLPVDWRAAKTVVAEAEKKPELPSDKTLDALDGVALACWYADSSLYSPVFIARLANDAGDRNAALKAVATWAIASPKVEGGEATSEKPGGMLKEETFDKQTIWRAVGANASDGEPQRSATPTVAARGEYIVFSPDGALVDLALDTLAHKNPSVVDQMPVSDATLGVVTPHRLSAMAERESYAALSGSGDENLLAAVRAHLPARMKALAAYPPYRLELAPKEEAQDGWRRVEWRTPKERGSERK
ncbi:MAG TPA: DUF2138 family protein [Burkholderiales bacterium]|nr:DUF2138 family protein [Burkholderiales bacterium]